VTAPGKRRRNTPTTLSSVVEYRMGIIGQTITDLGDAIVREMEEVGRIALPSVGCAALRSHRGDRKGSLATGDNECLAGGREDSECGNFLL
jgi:hypothetical protein